MTTALDATPDNLAGCKQGFGDIKGDMPLGDKALKPCGPSATPTATTTASEAPSADVDSEVDGHRFTFDETVIIFDWDDTVLPSSWVQEQGLRLDGESQLTPTQQEELLDLARLATETLTTAKTLGTVVLVTNAERGWIELSSRKFLPSLLPTLEDVKLLSARTEYERPEVVSPFEWKLRAFQHEILRLFHERGGGQQKRKNILSFGDSAHEREALIHATANLPNCRTKSLKFVERPRIETLRKQHSLVARCVKKIVHHDGNLDLCLRSLG
eukprot:TRINITY_DN2887_c0_g1_i3.p1 TRINITY_DN2887_c0_g1~~TRINITY_DN2887_c0_g1_i3.p1  ORF type:complete len:271 (+),score=68.58 TRINITY_DN2887_c0_g1_i3:304-1116(+)